MIFSIPQPPNAATVVAVRPTDWILDTLAIIEHQALGDGYLRLRVLPFPDEWVMRPDGSVVRLKYRNSVVEVFASDGMKTKSEDALPAPAALSEEDRSRIIDRVSA